MFEDPSRTMSFLQARDPSIVNRNCPNWRQIRVTFGRETLEASELENHLEVFLRIKNTHFTEDLYKIEQNILVCKVPPDSHAARNAREGDSVKKKYCFTKIFGPQSSQTEIFNNILKEKMLNFINGKNSSILTYGASGAGKTFTLYGTDEEPGLVPRALDYLFRTLPKHALNFKVKPLQNGDFAVLDECNFKLEKCLKSNILNNTKSQHEKTYRAMQQRLSSEPVGILDDVKNVSIGVWVSFAEIYNESIYDLLQPDIPKNKARTKLKLGWSNNNTHIKNLTSIPVTNGIEAYQLLQYGLQNLNYAATKLNPHSSRSHAIFTIKLVVSSETEQKSCVNYFNFCDLAGSERSKKTNNVGVRLQESNNINTSLLVLGRCIAAVREQQQQQQQNEKVLIPFRESKLTQLFQRALSGLEDISMIVNINPSRKMFDESHHVLNFSAIIKEVEVEPQQNNNRFSQYLRANKSSKLITKKEEEVEALKQLVSTLEEALEQQKLEAEQNEEQTCLQITQIFSQLLEDKNRTFEAQIKNFEELLQLKFELKLQQLKREYENKIIENNTSNILIDVANKEEEADVQMVISELRMIVEIQEQDIQKYRRRLKECQEILNRYKSERDDLELILRDAKSEFKDYCAVKGENVVLKERIFELEKEVDVLKCNLRELRCAYCTYDDDFWYPVSMPSSMNLNRRSTRYARNTRYFSSFEF